jgi:hypothetical protein
MKFFGRNVKREVDNSESVRSSETRGRAVLFAHLLRRLERRAEIARTAAARRWNSRIR